MSKVCLVVPCYNEALRFDSTSFDQFLRDEEDYRFVFVNDGSTDDTLRLLRSFADAHERAALVHLEQNVGKAEAVRQGILSALRQFDCRYVGYVDVDLATPLSEFKQFEAALETRPATRIAIGSRWKRLGADIQRSTLRHYLGRIFATLTSVLLAINVYDTQCGAKLMRREDLAEVMQEPFITSWFFDIEILRRYQAIHRGQAVSSWAVEIPLRTWREIKGSKIGPMDFVRAPFALLRIKRHY